MSLKQETVENCAYLARINLNQEDIPEYTRHLSRILEFVDQMNQLDTSNIMPMAHPLDMNQRLRDDEVMEKNQRDYFQEIAPAVNSGLYLVPKVVE